MIRSIYIAVLFSLKNVTIMEFDQSSIRSQGKRVCPSGCY